MKKVKNQKVKARIAAKKGLKKSQRKKVAKRHLEVKRKLIEALKIREEKIWDEHYNKLMGM